MFYVNLKVFQQPRILFKYLFEAQFDYWKFELSTKDGSFTTSLKHSGIGHQVYFLDFFHNYNENNFYSLRSDNVSPHDISDQ